MHTTAARPCPRAPPALRQAHRAQTPWRLSRIAHSMEQKHTLVSL